MHELKPKLFTKPENPKERTLCFEDSIQYLAGTWHIKTKDFLEQMRAIKKKTEKEPKTKYEWTKSKEDIFYIILGFYSTLNRKSKSKATEASTLTYYSDYCITACCWLFTRSANLDVNSWIKPIPMMEIFKRAEFIGPNGEGVLFSYKKLYRGLIDLANSYCMASKAKNRIRWPNAADYGKHGCECKLFASGKGQKLVYERFQHISRENSSLKWKMEKMEKELSILANDSIDDLSENRKLKFKVDDLEKRMNTQEEISFLRHWAPVKNQASRGCDLFTQRNQSKVPEVHPSIIIEAELKNQETDEAKGIRKPKFNSLDQRGDWLMKRSRDHTKNPKNVVFLSN
jgi:hypothetical protein